MPGSREPEALVGAPGAGDLRERGHCVLSRSTSTDALRGACAKESPW